MKSYSQVKRELMDVWDQLDEWESQIESFDIEMKVEIHNMMNNALNNNTVLYASPSSSHSWAYKGWELFRRVRAIQKQYPEWSDRIHKEVHSTFPFGFSKHGP